MIQLNFHTDFRNEKCRLALQTLEFSACVKFIKKQYKFPTKTVKKTKSYLGSTSVYLKH